jgi:Tfp pilus assembly protein PilN
MTHIDFLPPRYKERSELERSKLWYLGVLCVFGGAIAVATLYQFGVRAQVQSELAQVEAESNAAQATIQRVNQLQALAKSESADAELITWLRHPWPRTQLLGAIAAHLPDEVTLEDLRLDQEEAPKYRAAAPASPEQSPAEAPKLNPAARDLMKLRSLHEGKQAVVVLAGEARDTAALHTFLARIGSVGLYSKVELLSIESGNSNESSAAARFKAKLTIRRGFGQAGGPQAAWQPSPALVKQPLAQASKSEAAP